MDLTALADFTLVARYGGFGKASRASGRPKTTLSRQVMALEQSLGTRLVERGPSSITLTEDGEALFNRTDSLLSDIEEIKSSMGTGRDRATGRLRVSAPVLISHMTLGRVAAAFQRQYPDVMVEIVAEDRLVDPVADGYDLVIRVNPRITDELVGRCFLHDELLVVAPAGMKQPIFEPGSSESLPFPAVVLPNTPEFPTWTVGSADDLKNLRPHPIMRLSSLFMVADAVREGAGASRLPISIVHEDLNSGRLVSWGAVTDRKIQVWALHTSRRFASKKVTAFTDFLCSVFTGNSLAPKLK